MLSEWSHVNVSSLFLNVAYLTYSMRIDAWLHNSVYTSEHPVTDSYKEHVVMNDKWLNSPVC